MTKPAIARGLILMSALLALGELQEGRVLQRQPPMPMPIRCFFSTPAPNHRALLRYKIAEGTTTKSNMDFTIATLAKTSESAALSVVPGVRLHIVSGPAMATERGVKFEVKIAKAEAAIPQGLDPKVAKELQAERRHSRRRRRHGRDERPWCFLVDGAQRQGEEPRHSAAPLDDDRQCAHHAVSRRFAGRGRRTRGALGGSQGAPALRLHRCSRWTRTRWSSAWVTKSS